MKCSGTEFDRLVRGLSWWRSLGLNWVWRFVREECSVHFLREMMMMMMLSELGIVIDSGE